MDDFINDSQKYARWFGDTIGGVREVKLFGILNYKHAEFSQKQSKVVERQKKLNILSQWNNIIDTTLVQILVTVIYIIELIWCLNSNYRLEAFLCLLHIVLM